MDLMDQFFSLLFPWWNSFWWLPFLAFALDMCIGDPPRWQHPVRAIGVWLLWCEKPLRRLFSPFYGGLAGVLATLMVTGLVVAAALALPGIVGGIAAAYLAFTGLALGQLLREGARAAACIETGALDDARRAVGYLVSRDVSRADAETLYTVLAESLSENFTDGFMAPFFWLVVGGPLGLWLYKAVSTMDSCWGYPYEPWTRFGTACAVLDDMAAWIPARLSVLFLLAGAWLAGISYTRPGWKLLAAQARSMKSPNAGWSMACCAWVHGARMGGAAVYNGKQVEKPRLGPEQGVWGKASIRQLLWHLTVSACLAVGAAALVYTALALLG